MTKELKQTVVNEWGGAKPPIVEDDKEFLERKKKLQDFELQLVNVSQQDKLHEYLGVMLAVNNAFSDRSSAFLTVQTLLLDLSSFHSRIEKLEAASSKIFRGDRSRLCCLQKDLANFKIHTLEAGYAEKMANVWETVAEETSGYVNKTEILVCK